MWLEKKRVPIENGMQWIYIYIPRLQAIIKNLREIRIKIGTAVPDEELLESLHKLNNYVTSTSIGLPLRAYRQSQVVGVPRRLQAELEKTAHDAIHQHNRGDKVAYEGSCRELNTLIEEATEEWQKWRAQPEIDDVEPILKFGR